ncbi:hypothetical protein OPIT5_14785 [Opitutaceae bacterium TAV5]|nr:hypothetical protein OPIT5_14785 [Opitutaceae bacterium TAV5]
MSSRKTKSPALAGDDRNLVNLDETYVAASFEDKLRIFWGKYSRVVLALVTLAVLLVVGRGVMAHLAARHDEAVQDAYNAATGDDAALRAFASENSRHVLGAVANLEVADAAYARADYTAALAAYNEAVTTLAGTPFAARARLGAAMSQVLGGQAEAGRAALRQITDEISFPAPVRAEAAYHLAVLLREAGQNEDAAKLADQIFSIAPSSMWAQRGLMLKAQLPASAETPKEKADTPVPAAATDAAAPASTGETPAISFPASK